MKKLFILAVFLSANVFATEPELESVNREFSRLSQLENHLLQNPDLTAEQVKADFPELAGQMEFDNTTEVFDGRNSGTLGIPPFLWGCILGLIGIILVYILSDNDKEATKKALVGCLVGYGTALVVYLIFVFAVWGSFAAAF